MKVMGEKLFDGSLKGLMLVAAGLLMVECLLAPQILALFGFDLLMQMYWMFGAVTLLGFGLVELLLFLRRDNE